MKFALKILIVGGLMAGCAPEKSSQESTPSTAVNVYTHRHYESDQQLFERFEEITGIEVNVINASADELINRMELEGEASPADVLITVDAGRLHRAKEKGLLQMADSELLESNVPAKFRDPERHWFGITYRARIIAYSLDRVDPTTVTTYEVLTEPQWANKVLIRSSSNIYNQSLLASIIASQGTSQAKSWASGVKENMAREPKGNDRDQVKAVAAGLGDVAVLNTYYIGKLLNSDDQEQVDAGESIGIIFPNQDGRGTHVNISGVAMAKYAPNPENALKFIEFLSSDEAQKVFAETNFEYPVKTGVAWAPLLTSWGEFKTDTLNLALLGKHNKEAVMIFDEVGWK